MFRSSNTFGSKLRRIASFGSVGLASLALLIACSDGNTGGERDEADAGDPFVSDGGAGGTLEIDPNSDHIGVGETVGFHVRLRDSTGQGIPFIRIFCETERGVAIIEPSAGGVAFEHTDASGSMSGVIGGVTPGSYLMECRAQQGFNLVDRITIIVEGEVPVGFQGFPGAAGGNLGGGQLIDQTPDVDDGGTGLRITSIAFSDASGTDSLGPLDINRESTCALTGGAAAPETFRFTQYRVGISNGTAETIFVRSIRFRISDGGVDGQTSAQNSVLELGPGESGVLSGLLTQNSGCIPQPAVCSTVSQVTGICYSGGSGEAAQVERGTWPITATVTGATAADDSFSIDSTSTIRWDCVNNCGAS